MARPPDPRAVDGASLLTIYLVTLVGIQSRLVFTPLGGAGQPATLVACAGLLWWAYTRVQAPVDVSGIRPVRVALLAFPASVAASLVVALSRPLNATEFNTAMMGMISVAGWVGVGLVASEGLPSRHRHDQLIDRIVVAGTALATVGVIQFVTHDDIVTRLSIPGLSPTTALGGIAERSGFSRPAGTALHPIEFGSVITMILPLAIVRARWSTHGSGVIRWLPTMLMGLAACLSISRSAILSAALAVAILARAMPPRARLQLAGAIAALLTLVALTIPGMVGTLRGLFSSIGTDNSVASRSGSYPLAWEFINRAPILGRGYGTFLPAYRIFDNQYLLLLVEVGVVGTIAVVYVMVSGGAAMRARRRASGEARSEQSQALLAAVCAGAGGLFVFDGFSFPMSTGMLFLMVGLAGADAELSVGKSGFGPRALSTSGSERTRPLPASSSAGRAAQRLDS